MGAEIQFPQVTKFPPFTFTPVPGADAEAIVRSQYKRYPPKPNTVWETSRLDSAESVTAPCGVPITIKLGPGLPIIVDATYQYHPSGLWASRDSVKVASV